jgi:predicted DCC family thiol-disulfide oxidoreductase YuxK
MVASRFLECSEPLTAVPMKWLAVLYDDRCGICSRLRFWLERQSTFVPLRLVPLHSPGLSTRFPGIEGFRPDERLVVVSDEGRVWRGDGAWITLLWALREGRELAMKLASPSLRPLARKIVNAVSSNRLRLSSWFRLRPVSLIAESGCVDGGCRTVLR